jgi:molybdenum cofactor biosynthesis enzyme MoaA
MKIINEIIAYCLRASNKTRPKLLRVETTNNCNARCVTCPRSGMKRAVGVMDMHLFRSVIDQAVKMGIRNVHLHNYGEPLLDRTLPEKIFYAKQKGLHAKIFSNGSLMTPDMAERIIEAGIDEVKISVDGCTKETFERIRKPLVFEDVIKGIENLIQARAGRSRPGISLVFVDFDQNHSEVAALKKKWGPRVDSVIVTEYHNWAKGAAGKVSLRQRLQKKIPCARLWKTVTVLWDGRVALCCLDYNGDVILGDVSKEPLSSVWSGEKYSQLRRLHAQGAQEKIFLCSECTIGRL